MRPPNNNIVHRSLFTTHTHVYKISNFFTPFHVIKQNLISQDYKSHQWRLNQFFESLSFSVVKGNSTYIAQSERTTLGSNLPWTCRRIIPLYYLSPCTQRITWAGLRSIAHMNSWRAAVLTSGSELCTRIERSWGVSGHRRNCCPRHACINR